MKPIESAIVRIFAQNKTSIVGVGFLIDGKRVMTCAHVVAKAFGIARDTSVQDLPVERITLDFPLVDDNHPCAASVVLWLPPMPDETGDIAVLELDQQRPFSTAPAKLVEPSKYWDKPFGTYGYPQSIGGWASGVVRGRIAGNRLQIINKDEKSYFIQPGFSGSPVYCDESGVQGVIGMVASGETDPKLEVGFMISAEVLLKVKDQRNVQPLVSSEPTEVPKTVTGETPTSGDQSSATHVFSREFAPRVVYIGKFVEMRRQLKLKHVFVAHPFFGGDAQKLTDYRYYLKDGLESIGYEPLFARDDPGYLLETICRDIIDTEAGIYDVTGYNANVLIELGMSIGLNQPTVVIAEDDNAPLIPPLQQLNPIRYTNRYDLTDLIGPAVNQRIQAYRQAGMSPRFCASCGLDCIARKPRQSPESEYLVIGADPQKDKAIFHHLKKAVKNFDLTWHQLEGEFNLVVCQWTEEIKRCKLVFFRSTEGTTRHSGTDNATTMVQVGMAVGMGIAWRMILKSGERMPTDLEGFKYTTWDDSPMVFEASLTSAVRQLLGEARPYIGTYDPLIPTEHFEDDTVLESPIEHIDIDTVILVVNDNDTERLKLVRLLRSQGWAVIEARTNNEALDHVSRNEFTLIITDIERNADRYGEEGTLGLDLVKALQDRFPTLIYTAYRENYARQLLEGLRPVGIISRATDDQEIVIAIKKSIADARLAREKNDLAFRDSSNKQILITYSPRNQLATSFARQLNENLKEQQFTTWIDHEHHEDWSGNEWQSAIQPVIENSAYLIAVYTEEQSNSKDFYYEIDYADGLQIPILVILPQSSSFDPMVVLPPNIAKLAIAVLDANADSNWYQQLLSYLVSDGEEATSKYAEANSSLADTSTTLNPLTGELPVSSEKDEFDLSFLQLDNDFERYVATQLIKSGWNSGSFRIQQDLLIETNTRTVKLDFSLSIADDKLLAFVTFVPSEVPMSTAFDETQIVAKILSVASAYLVSTEKRFYEVDVIRETVSEVTVLPSVTELLKRASGTEQKAEITQGTPLSAGLGDRIVVDYDGLMMIAAQFETGSQLLQSTVGTLSQVVDSVKNNYWVAESADSFYFEMDTDIFPALNRLLEAFAAASETTKQLSELFEKSEQEASN